MRTTHYYEQATIPDLYTWFGGEAAPTSTAWRRTCEYVASTPELAALLDTLPGGKRQPNLYLGAIRFLGGPQRPEGLLDWTVTNWPAIERVILGHRTQTNEVGRCAVLAPALASLPQPVALIEVGMSAGLCLFPDAYGYRWSHEDGRVTERDSAVAGAPTLECAVTGDGLPLALPEVAWRAGIDSHPLDPTDPETGRWLRALVWPGEDAREERLAAALAAVGTRHVTRVTGDCTDALPALVAQAPAGTTVVVQQSAVLAYLTKDARARHLDALRALGVHWVTNEGPTVVPSIAQQLTGTEPRPHFVLALDGVPLARVGSHGAWLDWL